MLSLLTAVMVISMGTVHSGHPRSALSDHAGFPGDGAVVIGQSEKQQRLD